MVQNIKKSKMPKNDATKLKIGTQTDQIILNTIAFFSRKYRNFFFDLAVFPPEGIMRILCAKCGHFSHITQTLCIYDVTTNMSHCDKLNVASK